MFCSSHFCKIIFSQNYSNLLMLCRKPFPISDGILHLCTMSIQESFIAFSEWRREQLFLVNHLGIEKIRKNKEKPDYSVILWKADTRDRINGAVTKISIVAVLEEQPQSFLLSPNIFITQLKASCAEWDNWDFFKDEILFSGSIIPTKNHKSFYGIGTFGTPFTPLCVHFRKTNYFIII